MALQNLSGLGKWIDMKPETDQQKIETVGQHLDKRIALIRQSLEQACIVKAKAETLQILDYPVDFMQSLFAYPF